MRWQRWSKAWMFYSQVPLFVQIHQKWRRMYVGECQGPGVRTDFEMVHLRKVPSQYTHLSGLLDVFKSKIVSASVYTYLIRRIITVTWLPFIYGILLYLVVESKILHWHVKKSFCFAAYLQQLPLSYSPHKLYLLLKRRGEGWGACLFWYLELQHPTYYK